MVQDQNFVLVSETRLNQIQSDISSLKELISSKKPQREISGIEMAVEITGMSKATIYSKVAKEEIPFIKRGGRLYFERTKLIDWIKAGRKGGES